MAPDGPNDARLTPTSPPPVVRRVINPVLRVLLQSRLRTPVDGALAVLTFLGRKSGQQYRLVVGYVALGDGSFRVWTHGGWKANFRGDDGHPATLRVRGRDHLVTGRSVEDPEVVAADAYQFVSTGGDPRRMGMLVRGEGPLTHDDVRAVVPPLSCVDFRPRGAAG